MKIQELDPRGPVDDPCVRSELNRRMNENRVIAAWKTYENSRVIRKRRRKAWAPVFHQLAYYSALLAVCYLLAALFGA